MIIVSNKRKATEFTVPVGGEILWYGVAASVPSGWGIDAYASNVFVRGAAQNQATNTVAGGTSHQHSNPSTTGSDAGHTHTIGGGSTGTSTGSMSLYPTANYSHAPVHSHGIPSVSSGSAGSHSHSMGATALASNVYPPYARLYWIKMVTPAAVPIGAIVMLDAPIANRPSGFELCNGTGGTIDLRDKFVYGAAIDADVGATGGATTHTHTNPTTGAAGTHSHSLIIAVNGSSSIPDASGFEGDQAALGGHDHTINTTSNADADHTHTASDTGSGTNLPQYLKLYFVQRTA